jgi:hypothetical protein
MKNKKDNTNKDVLVSSIIEKKEKNKPIIYILSIITIVLIIILLYTIFTKNNCDEELQCSSVTNKEIEVEPKYQLINYNGFRFKMPLNWDFINNDNKYEIADKDDKLYIFFNIENVDFNLFISNEYQRQFLELIQTSGDIKINLNKVKEESEKKYYLYEGAYKDYDDLIVAVGNKEKTILINAKFIDKISYNELKEEVINFAFTAI